MKALLALLALMAPAAAWAAGDVALTSSIFVERVQQDSEGRRTVVLEPPSIVTPGDHLVFRLDYRNNGGQPATGFVVTNPIPDSIAFESVDGDALVSVDGGRSWGRLDALRVALPDGTDRRALPADVSHIRWTFSRPIAAGSNGRLSFRGVVE
jgi:uncharacterized repeat protein (TIGR01451 family)